MSTVYLSSNEILKHEKIDKDRINHVLYTGTIGSQ